MSLQTDNLNFEPLVWGDCTFWYNRETQNFEVYGSHNFLLYKIGGAWVMEMSIYEWHKPLIIWTNLPLFQRRELRDLLALVKIINSKFPYPFPFVEGTFMILEQFIKKELLDVPSWLSEL